jgi:hypothetical protein
MQELVSQWEALADRMAIVLSCNMMMTRNTLAAIDQHEFGGSVWVADLLNRFGDYYFAALKAYEQEPTAAPRVWQLAHDTTRERRAIGVQELLLGVNAHINHDLVLTLVDVL